MKKIRLLAGYQNYKNKIAGSCGWEGIKTDTFKFFMERKKKKKEECRSKQLFSFFFLHETNPYLYRIAKNIGRNKEKNEKILLKCERQG